jgi:hypothetical protein
VRAVVTVVLSGHLTLATDSIGSARFLKTVKCRHRNGFLVIKIFIKPDPGLSLRTYMRRLKSEFLVCLFHGQVLK